MLSFIFSNESTLWSPHTARGTYRVWVVLEQCISSTLSPYTSEHQWQSVQRACAHIVDDVRVCECAQMRLIWYTNPTDGCFYTHLAWVGIGECVNYRKQQAGGQAASHWTISIFISTPISFCLSIATVCCSPHEILFRFLVRSFVRFRK